MATMRGAGGMRGRGKQRPWKRWLALFIVLAIVIGGAKTCTHITGKPNPVDTALAWLVAPVIGVPHSIGQGFSKLGDVPSALHENENLRAENMLLERRVAELRHLEDENAQLKQLLQLAPPPEFTSVTARVIARPYDLWLESVWINVGLSDGVRAGNLVVNAAGVVGIIKNTELHMSSITLISSPEFHLGAVTPDEQVAGVIHGVDGRTMVLGDIPVGPTVKPGEKVFTRGEETYPGGEDNRPRGVYIGMTSRVEHDASGYLRIIIEPAANVNNLGHVTVHTQ